MYLEIERGGRDGVWNIEIARQQARQEETLGVHFSAAAAATPKKKWSHSFKRMFQLLHSDVSFKSRLKNISDRFAVLYNMNKVELLCFDIYICIS